MGDRLRRIWDLGRAIAVKLSKMSSGVGNGSLCLTINVENPVG